MRAKRAGTPAQEGSLPGGIRPQPALSKDPELRPPRTPERLRFGTPALRGLPRTVLRLNPAVRRPSLAGPPARFARHLPVPGRDYLGIAVRSKSTRSSTGNPSRCRRKRSSPISVAPSRTHSRPPNSRALRAFFLDFHGALIGIEIALCQRQHTTAKRNFDTDGKLPTTNGAARTAPSNAITWRLGSG